MRNALTPPLPITLGGPQLMLHRGGTDTWKPSTLWEAHRRCSGSIWVWNQAAEPPRYPGVVGHTVGLRECPQEHALLASTG